MYYLLSYLIRVLDNLEMGACLLTGKGVAEDMSNEDIKGLSSSSRCEADGGGGSESVPDEQRKLFAAVHIE